MDTKQEPKTFQVTVNKIGVKPAGAIATLALHKSAEVFKAEFPDTARQLQARSYVDDLGIAAENSELLRKRTKEADAILKHANMAVKKWTYSDDQTGGMVSVGEPVSADAKSDVETERMLGVTWDPAKDSFKFKVVVNLSTLKNKTRTGPNLTKEDLLSTPPQSISRRQYYSLIQSLFDPIELLSPVLLRAKILLRRTWEGSCADIKWDDPLPDDLVKEMIAFLVELFDLEDLDFSRSLWPCEEVIGKPDLVMFSDGSVLAFGAVAYIRWKLKSGGWWTSLIMSKSKIAPKNRITIPWLELNGAVLSKRLREFITNQVDLEFENTWI